MMRYIKHLWLAILLIGIASVILLVSDLDRRISAKKTSGEFASIALMQFTSTPLLDEHVAGITDKLRKAGCLTPDEDNLHLFNPQGDYATGNAVAREMVDGDHDILITSSTVALQLVAKANQTAKKPHIFGAVTFPQGAGVGITGEDANQHPPYLTGIGTFQPVERAFEIIHELNPSLKRVGVVWNPGEQCSEACLMKARKICNELDIELIEANASNTSEVNEALRSILAKNVEAIWIGGDTVANASSSMIVKQAAREKIPVFSNDPMDAQAGALFGLGANYYTVGEYTAAMAAEVIAGRSPASYKIENIIPERFVLNRQVLANLTAPWHITASIEALTKSSQDQKKTAKPKPEEHYTVALSYYVPAPIFEQAIKGFRKELAKKGFIEGKNLTLHTAHANGEMGLLPQVTASLLQKNPDVFVPFSTPCLANAIAHGNDVNIVFGIVSAPLEAGAGKSFTNHLPNVTGVVQTLPTEELFDRMQQLFPDVHRIGVLYNPSEANSVKEIEDLKRIFHPRGLELVSTVVYTSSEVAENIQGLLAQKVDMIFLMADNTTANAMPAIVHACRKQDIPVIADDSSLMGQGAIMSCAPGPCSDGAQTANIVMQVLLGQSPRHIPIESSKYNELALDLKAARQNNLILPEDLLKRADLFFNLNTRYNNKPARIAMINLVNNELLDQAEHGVETELQAFGLEPDRDYTITHYNAQGDMSQIPQILQTIQADNPDLVITLTTPVMMAAAKKIHDIPVVFTVASDPKQLNLFPNGRPDHICGVYDDPPIDALVEMAQRNKPSLHVLGIVYDASQDNSVISVEKLRLCAERRGLKLLEATIASVSDLPTATHSLIERGSEALILSADNTTATGFPAIQKVAHASGIPVYATEPSLIDQGATGAVGTDYAAWGRQSGKSAARILAGVPPSTLPIEPAEEIISVNRK